MIWFRVFGISEREPAPTALLEHVQRLEPEAQGRFRGDEQGWFELRLTFTSGEALTLERFLATEEGIRSELNSWAAWLESIEDKPSVPWLMQHLIGTRQVFTLHSEDAADEEFCTRVCQYLAGTTEGVYQIDGNGFFDANGILLVKEES